MVTVDSSVWVSAAEPGDSFCGPSRAFLSRLAREGATIHVPAFAGVEVGCALARRCGDGAAARRLAEVMLAGPLVVRHDMDTALLATALRAGTEALLRGADALFAAVAQATGTTLVTWDEELLQRGGGRTPGDWLAG